MKKEYDANAEVKKEKSREYYARVSTEDPQKIRDQAKEQRAKDPEKYRLIDKIWREENPDKVQATRIRWKENHPEHQQKIERQSEEKRRAQKLGQFVENIDRQTVYDMHGGMCGICEEFIVGKFHVDHVIPLSKGGLHGYVNVQPAHPKCNVEKAAKV
jgi:5-methylcytosine-specific restriction endonuclease McrA